MRKTLAELKHLNYVGRKFNLDPDFRPKIPHGCKEIRCAKCQRVIKNIEKAIQGYADFDNHIFIPSFSGKNYVGQDCWNIIKKDNIK